MLCTLSIFLFVFFLILRKNFKNKEIFLQNSVDQLRLEKSILENSLLEREETFIKLEKELHELRQMNLDSSLQREKLEDEIKALRNLIESLQRPKNSKNDDIIVEYIMKP